jgi:magnesium-transporting ATPase (P-type)
MTTAEKPAASAPPPKRKAPNVRLPSRLMAEAARMEAPEALKLLDTSMRAAAERLEEVGPNEVSSEKHHNWATRLWHAVRNPLVILLTVLAVISFSTAQETSDYVGAWLMVRWSSSAWPCASSRNPRRTPPRPS